MQEILLNILLHGGCVAGNSTTLVSCDYGYIYDRQPGEITATMEVSIGNNKITAAVG